MKTILRSAWCWCLLAVGSALADPAGLVVPEGFTVTEVAGPNLANDIHAMTVDPKGRIVVSSRGYIRTLVDDDGDGAADRAIDFAKGPNFGAMGLWCEEDRLFAADDGALWLYHDRDGDARADGPPTVLLQLSRGGEHGMHAIRRGPDGWLYVIVGNACAVGAKQITSDTSPVKDPTAGALLRLDPEFKRLEVVADGFRNPYDFDFGPDGEIFAYDSDNERCVGLPWYEPTRFYHVVPGGWHGWRGYSRGETWRAPPYLPDIIAPVAELGRGSPTGVVCYRHTQFPKRYREALFALDWTFGRVIAVMPASNGSTYSATTELFMHAKEGAGFAPTDAEVDPRTGDLFVSVGGRGTRGAVYRVRFGAGYHEPLPHRPSGLELAPRDLDGTNDFSVAIARAITPNDPARFRRGLESMFRFVDRTDPSVLDRAVATGLDSDDLLVRQAAHRLEVERRRSGHDTLADDDLPRTARALAHVVGTGLADDDCWQRLRESAAALTSSSSDEDWLSIVRAAQLLVDDIGDDRRITQIWVGYSRRKDAQPADQVPSELFAHFPTGRFAVDRELSRLAAMIALDDPSFEQRVAQRIQPDSDPADDIHHLAVLARLSADPTPISAGTLAEALLALDAKVSASGQRIDRNWPLRVREIQLALLKRRPTLNQAMVDSPAFGRPAHTLWCQAPSFDRTSAARKFLERAESLDDEQWTVEYVEMLATLPGEVVAPLLRGQWDLVPLRPAIVDVLIQTPVTDDGPRILDVLEVGDAGLVNRILDAAESNAVLADLFASERFDHIIARRARQKDDRPIVERMMALRPSSARSFEEWLESYAQRFPEEWARWANPDGVDRSQWEKRLDTVDWAKGDIARGRLLFHRLGCAQCHAGVSSVGPDLAGVSKRFARTDLIQAVIEPSRDVSDRYRSTRFLMVDGRVEVGMVVYEAADGAIIRDSSLETKRLLPEEIEHRSPSPRSFMPAGLMDHAEPADWADLVRYLESI